MAILLDETSRVIIQGVTGSVGRGFAERYSANYANFVGGVSPGKGGQEVAGRPVFDSVAEALAATDADVSVVTVPAARAGDAIVEALEAGVRLISVYTDLIPVHEAAFCIRYARARGARIIGPNAAGIVSPGRASACELRDSLVRPGPVGVVTKSGSLAYEVVAALNGIGLGQSTICCLGGDPLIGTDFREVLELFAADDATEGVVLVGEVGGDDEMRALDAVRALGKPLVAYVVGRSAPSGKSMGHAGAIAGRADESAQAKLAALSRTGAHTAELLEELPAVLRASLGHLAS